MNPAARRPPDKNTRLSNGVAFRFREVRAGAFKRVVVATNWSAHFSSL